MATALKDIHFNTPMLTGTANQKGGVDFALGGSDTLGPISCGGSDTWYFKGTAENANNAYSAQTADIAHHATEATHAAYIGEETGRLSYSDIKNKLDYINNGRFNGSCANADSADYALNAQHASYAEGANYATLLGGPDGSLTYGAVDAKISNITQPFTSGFGTAGSNDWYFNGYAKGVSDGESEILSYIDIRNAIGTLESGVYYDSSAWRFNGYAAGLAVGPTMVIGDSSGYSYATIEYASVGNLPAGAKVLYIVP